MASVFKVFLASYQVGFEVGYTLLGSKHFVKQLNIPPIMHTNENINAVVKVGRRYVCHLPW
jgi:hypothetical protein